MGFKHLHKKIRLNGGAAKRRNGNMATLKHKRFHKKRQHYGYMDELNTSESWANQTKLWLQN